MDQKEVAREVKKKSIFIELNENEKTTYQNLWDTAKAVLRGKSTCEMLTLEKMESLKSITLFWGYCSRHSISTTRTPLEGY